MTTHCPSIHPNRWPDNAATAGALSRTSTTTWRNVLLPFLATRFGLLLICLAGPRFLSPHGLAPHFVEFFSRFDQWWYLGIARDGYFFDPSRQSSIAFAPLLPMLMRTIGLALGSGDAALLSAGIVVSNLALLIALFFIHAIAGEQYGNRVARRAVFYVTICPCTIFLSVVYPMSLMLAIAAGAIWCARRGRWELAGAIGMLAPLARPDGILLVLPLMLEAARSKRKHPRMVWLAMIPAMSAIWLAGQWLAFGTPLAFVHAQKMWEPSPLITILYSSRAPLILGIAAFFVLLTVLGWFTLPGACSLYATLFLGLMLWAGRLWSLPRFVVILFPCMITLAWLGMRWKWLHVFYVVSATLMAAVFALRFSLYLWVA